MPQVPAALPKIESDDADLVVMALETAATLWESGDEREALRWLRKAAEAASDAGADLRSVALAKAAADLTTALELGPAPSGASAARAGEALPWESPTDAPATTRTSSKPPAPAPSAAPRARQTTRVAVAPGPRAGVFLIRVLGDTEPLPEGTAEALLIAMQPGVDLL